MDVSLGYLSGRLTFELDRAADQLLQAHLGISYKRVLFLIVLAHRGTVTQHELALALGYSDPAVSAMLVELVGGGHVRATKSPEHGRKRLVTITPKGSEMVARARQLLDAHFDRLLVIAGVDAQLYRELIERLLRALLAKTEGER